MQRPLNQHAKLSVKIAAALFSTIFIIEGDRPACEKNGLDPQLIADHPVFRFETDPD